jgi:glycosyltransferase involved in cell wall biosynthesis
VTSKKANRIYLYPITSRGEDISANPYISNLSDAIKSLGEIININKPSGSGIFQMLFYFPKYNILFLNWIENLPDRKGGIIQSFLLFFLISLCRLTGKKVIWVMHNKVSHSKTNYRIKRILFKYLLRKSHLILTHSTEGIRYANSLLSKPGNNIHYIPHPFARNCISTTNETHPKYDFLIWGSMVPYKAVDVFLNYLQESGQQDDFRIKIIGRFSSESYLEKVRNIAGKKTEIVNRFASNKELKELISMSRFVLFTYHDNSVLSSGALMDTICYGGNVIGPSTGAFADLAEEKLIFNYKTYADIPGFLKSNHHLKLKEVNLLRKEFINLNTWDSFGIKLKSLV